MQRNIVAAGLAIIAMALLVACGGDDEPAFACPKGPVQNQCAGIVKDYESGPKDEASRAAAAAKIAALYGPTSQAPQGSTSQPSTAGNPPSGNLVMTNLLDGRSENPRTVMAKIPGTDCPVYQDTGKGNSASYDCPIPAGWTALAFGVNVLNDETHEGWDNGGFMAFVGPTTMRVTIVDGAYSTKPSGDRAYQDFCDRLKQHNEPENGWLASNSLLPPNWDPKCGRP